MLGRWLLGLWLLLLAAGAGLLGSWHLAAGPEAAARPEAAGPEAAGPEAAARPEACPRPRAAALQRLPRFQRLVDLSAPVLLWAGLLTPQLWDDLSRLQGPYGWSGLSREAVASTLSLLRGGESARLLAAAPGARCVRCAVVANGGILNGSRQGRRIDGHDYVFRVNGAVIKGFESDVGTRTSFYGFTVNTMKSSLRRYRHLGFLAVPRGPGVSYVFIPTNLRDLLMLRSALLGVPVPEGEDAGDRPQAYFGRGAPAGKFKLLHPKFIQYLTLRFLNSSWSDWRTEDIYMPSTGALMLLTALHTCDQVSAYGFITKNYRAFSEHYFDRKKKPLQFYSNHDLLLEARLWEDLHKAGVIQLYQSGPPSS